MRILMQTFFIVSFVIVTNLQLIAQNDQTVKYARQTMLRATQFMVKYDDLRDLIGLSGKGRIQYID